MRHIVPSGMSMAVKRALVSIVLDGTVRDHIRLEGS